MENSFARVLTNAYACLCANSFCVGALAPVFCFLQGVQDSIVFSIDTSDSCLQCAVIWTFQISARDRLMPRASAEASLEAKSAVRSVHPNRPNVK